MFSCFWCHKSPCAPAKSALPSKSPCAPASPSSLLRNENWKKAPKDFPPPPQDYHSKGPEHHKVQFGLRPQACDHLLHLLHLPSDVWSPNRKHISPTGVDILVHFVHSGVVQPSLPGDGWDRLTGEQSTSPTGFHPALLPIWIHRYLDSPSWGGARPSWRGESILFWTLFWIFILLAVRSRLCYICGCWDYFTLKKCVNLILTLVPCVWADHRPTFTVSRCYICL